jgi:predicted ATPase
MTAEEQARALVREAKAEGPLSLPWVDAVVDAYVWRFGPGATATRQRDLLVALQEQAGHLDPLQFAILKGRIANF